MKLENRTQLTLLREQCQEKRNKETCKILVCGGTGCLAGGLTKSLTDSVTDSGYGSC